MIPPHLLRSSEVSRMLILRHSLRLAPGADLPHAFLIPSGSEMRAVHAIVPRKGRS